MLKRFTKELHSNTILILMITRKLNKTRQHFDTEKILISKPPQFFSSTTTSDTSSRWRPLNGSVSDRFEVVKNGNFFVLVKLLSRKAERHQIHESADPTVESSRVIFYVNVVAEGLGGRVGPVRLQPDIVNQWGRAKVKKEACDRGLT